MISIDTHSLWMPTRRRAGISAQKGRSVPIGYVFVTEDVRPLVLTLKEGET